MMTGMVHSLTRREIFQRMLVLRREGKLYDLSNPVQDEVFTGCVDRFADIAFRLRGCRKVLDVGSGHGLLLAVLDELGHECYGVDFTDQTEHYPEIYRNRPIHFQVSNAEVDPLPFADDTFDAVTCCQVLEHFTHSHLPLMREIRRVLRPGGIAEVDVPNAVSFRNRSRMLRGKHITNDYETHFLRAEPILYKGMSFYPVRHNREFTAAELRLLFEAAGFRHIQVSFLKGRRYREGARRFLSAGTMLRDAVPSLRKFLIAFAEK